MLCFDSVLTVLMETAFILSVAGGYILSMSLKRSEWLKLPAAVSSASRPPQFNKSIISFIFRPI